MTTTRAALEAARDSLERTAIRNHLHLFRILVVCEACGNTAREERFLTHKSDCAIALINAALKEEEE